MKRKYKKMIKIPSYRRLEDYSPAISSETRPKNITISVKNNHNLIDRSVIDDFIDHKFNNLVITEIELV